jgi:phosphoribosylformimino-5-aminoimidazole carboxamide ribotide isomerase
MLIIPAIDLRQGQCVRLFEGRFDSVTRYSVTPQEQVSAFAEAGAEWIHVVDLDGARTGEPCQHDLIGSLASASKARVQAGGGVRTADHVQALLDAGVDRVVVGSVAVRDPAEVASWMGRFGPERIVLALDVRLGPDGPVVVVHGWTASSGVLLTEALTRAAGDGAQQVLVTDVSRDGALAGPNTDMIAEMVSAYPALSFQASGGVSSLDDLKGLSASGAQAAIVGKALYEGRFGLREAIDAG